MDTADSPALLLLDLPASALAGIDLLSFTVSPRFRGVKAVPAGLHFAFCGTSAAFSERHGLWFAIPHRRESGGGGGGGEEAPPLVVARWDAAAETLGAETDEAARMRARANLGAVWRTGLMPYRQGAGAGEEGSEARVDDWPALTSCVTPALLARVMGSEAHWVLTSASSAPRDLEDIPGLTGGDRAELLADRELRLLPIDLKCTWPADATGRERTVHARDRSWAVGQLARESCARAGDWDEVLGEMQFAFLMILTLNNFSCLEQWRRILELVLTCRAAVATHADFFVRFVATLRLQLQHCRDAEGGLIDLADEAGSMLKGLLVRFRKGLDGMTGPGILDVVDELDDLEDSLQREHGWQFEGDFARSGVLELEDGEQVQMESTAFDEEDETGEFAPQVVELTTEQAKLLSITPGDARPPGASLSKASLDDGVVDVVQDSDDEEKRGESEESEEEETQTLEEMDSRF